MIHVAKLNDLSFSIRFDEKLAQTLSELSGWCSVENFIQAILSDTILGSPHRDDFLADLDDDVPF